MGRPLNKRYFGEPTVDGKEIKVQFNEGTGSKSGWIVKQKASKRFLVTDGTVEGICSLVDKASGDLLEGEMSITVKDDAGVAKQVVKIAGRKVTVDTGESIAWNFDTSTTDGKVEIEEAGDDAAMTNNTDLEGDLD